MTTATDERVDADILEALDFEEAPPTCDYTDCENEAAAKLVCGVCGMISGGGVELMCQDHTVATAIAQQQVPEEMVIFDRTCKHRPELGNCSIVPL